MKYISKFEGLFNTEGDHNVLNSIFIKITETININIVKEKDKYIVYKIKLDEYTGTYDLKVDTNEITIEYHKNNKIAFTIVMNTPILIVRKIYYLLDTKYNKNNI
jgi:hypothetical protein